MRNVLYSAWATEFGNLEAASLVAGFDLLAEELRQSGAVIVARLLDPDRMIEVIHEYDRHMRAQGSESLLHAYANLANDAELLKGSLRPLLHPILLTLIADAVGGPISLVDGRAKDAGPLEVRAQDNMLHIDNTPFNDEYKVLWLWRKGEAKGPSGQNFTFLPGTNRAARNCLISESGEPFSTENASIFVTEESLLALRDVQKAILGREKATIVEVQDEEPLAVAFAAGSLVHHRYRTAEGHSRSCAILAFHRAADVRVPLFPPESDEADLIEQVLGGAHNDRCEANFLSALGRASSTIARTLRDLKSGLTTRHVAQDPISLEEAEMQRWLHQVTAAPEIEDIKRNRSDRTGSQPLHRSLIPRVLAREMMLFDKHGPLDLILYADSREEVRKFARNKIREMSVAEMENRLVKWCEKIEDSQLDHLMTQTEVSAFAVELAKVAATEATLQPQSGRLLSSLERLSLDLAEAVLRPYSLQNFLSTSLFVFWIADELVEAGALSLKQASDIGIRLLEHYIALAMLIDAQVSE